MVQMYSIYQALLEDKRVDRIQIGRPNRGGESNQDSRTALNAI